jgi:hypothetical protein
MTSLGGESLSRADDLEIVLGDEVIERSFTENLVGVAEEEEKQIYGRISGRIFVLRLWRERRSLQGKDQVGREVRGAGT